MEGYQHEISLIKKILKENPKGMTVTDISRKIKINRNSVAKYLDIMRISGHVEMITFGPAKVFFPSRRVPISDMLNYTSDYILVFDTNLKITIVNNSFLHFIKLNREEVISHRINIIIEKIFKNNKELFVGIKEALEGKNFNQDINFQKNKNNYFFKVKVVPTTFEDGKQGGTLIIKNNTDHKIVEKILRESEENFRDLLSKINKK